jgi:hypothetical protein
VFATIAGITGIATLVAAIVGNDCKTLVSIVAVVGAHLVARARPHFTVL